jgi:hypothetical protein
MKKNWKTTIGGVFAALLVVLGIFIPDIDPETQVAANAAVGQILTGVGALIALITGWFAKDPE